MKAASNVKLIIMEITLNKAQKYEDSSTRIQNPRKFQYFNISPSNRFNDKQSKTKLVLAYSKDISLDRSLTPKQVYNKSLKKKLQSLKKEDFFRQNNSVKYNFNDVYQELPNLRKKFSKSMKNNKKIVHVSLNEGRKTPINMIRQVYSPEALHSTFVKKQNNLKNSPKEMKELQKYVFDFHAKSKLLLNQLEQKVLGKDN